MLDFKRIKRIFLKKWGGGAVFPSEFSPSDDCIVGMYISDIWPGKIFKTALH